MKRSEMYSNKAGFVELIIQLLTYDVSVSEIIINVYVG